MSTYDIIHPEGIVDRFVSELAAHTTEAEALRAAMEPGSADCTYSETALDIQNVKVALRTLKEKGTGAAYEYRYSGRFLFNPYAMDNYRATQEIPATAQLSCVNTTPGPKMTFNSFENISLQNTGGATYTEASNSIIITTTGVWRVMLSLGVAFYPKGKVSEDVRYQTRKAHTNTNFKSLPVNAFLIVKTSAGAVRLIHQLGSTRMSRQEINEDRVKRFGGATTLALTAGESVQIEIQRGGDFGTVVDGATNTTVKECLGLRKIGDIAIGGSPTRDAYNQLILTRIV